jgi:hypothetical protein
VRDAFPLLYLPARVTFRFTDILRGLVAQPILWLRDRLIGFTKATVRQERNPHDYLKDFISEMPCYLHAEEVIAAVSAAVEAKYSTAENLFLAYEALQRKGIVPEDELPIVNAWLRDLHSLAT